MCVPGFRKEKSCEWSNFIVHRVNRRFPDTAKCAERKVLGHLSYIIFFTKVYYCHSVKFLIGIENTYLILKKSRRYSDFEFETQRSFKKCTKNTLKVKLIRKSKNFDLWFFFPADEQTIRAGTR